MDDEAGWLIDDDDVGVLVEDLERQVLGDDLRGPDVRDDDLNGLVCLDAERRLQRRPRINSDLAFGNEPRERTAAVVG